MSAHPLLRPTGATAARPPDHDHAALRYEHDVALHAAAAGLLADSLRTGGSVLVLATAAHRCGIEAALRGLDVDLGAAERASRYLEVDADEELAAIIEAGGAATDRIATLVAAHARTARRGGGRLHVLGELVGMLQEQGLFDAASELDAHWQRLLDDHDVKLTCTYPGDTDAVDRLDGHGATLDRCTAMLGSRPSRPVPTSPGPIVGPAVLDALDCHLAIIDGAGRILAINAAWERFAAANGGSEVGVGADYFAVCRATDDPRAAAALEGLEAVASGAASTFSLDYPCHSPDELRWFRMLATPVTDGGPTRLVIRHNAITAEKLAHDTAEVRSQLLDAVDAAVIATGLDGVIEVWNDGAEQLLGWSADEAVGRAAAQLLTPADVPEEAGMLTSSILKRGSWEGELQLARRDGHTVRAHVRNRVIRDDAGKPRGLIGVAVDLSERIAHERALVHSNTWLRAITDRMGEGLCTLTAEGRIAYVNPAGEHLLAAPDQVAIGGSFTQRLLGTRSDGSPRRVEELLIGDDIELALPCEAVEDRLLRNDGTTLPIEYVANQLPIDPYGRHNGWVLVFRDITERVEQQRRLRSEADSARWMARIQDALEHDRFELHAQPIVDVTTGAVRQNELLLRLADLDEGLIEPAEFLPTAEAYGLITAIDRWVIGRAVGYAAEGYPVELNSRHARSATRCCPT